MNDKKKFSVFTMVIYDKNERDYVNWSKGLTMYIQKDGIEIELNEKEIEELVKTLPRTIGGTYG